MDITGFWFKRTDDGLVDITPEVEPEVTHIPVKDILTVTQYMADRHGRLIEVWGFDEEVTPF